MNWDNPEDRAALIERVGAEEYNRRAAQHRRDSVIETVNGHEIRPSRSLRFGLLYMVGNTGRAFSSLDAARDFAKAERTKR